MADRYYQMEFGQKMQNVVEAGASAGAADVEVRLTYDAANNSKMAALLALDEIKKKIVRGPWPPA